MKDHTNEMASRALLNGTPPNGKLPADCGAWADRPTADNDSEAVDLSEAGLVDSAIVTAPSGNGSSPRNGPADLPQDDAQATATRLTWGGWHKGQATLRRGKIRYNVIPDGDALDVRATASQGKGHVDLTFDLRTPDYDDAGAQLVGLGLALTDARADLVGLGASLAADDRAAVRAGSRVMKGCPNT